MIKILHARLQHTWTVNFQMFKLVLENAEEPEIKLPTSVGSSKSKKVTEKYLLLYWLCQSFDFVDHNTLWIILKEIGIPDHLTCHLINLYAGQAATVRTGHRTTDLFQIRKEVCQGCILSPCLFNLYAEMLGWKKHKLESRLPGEISITSDMQMTPLLWQRQRRSKEPLDESERGEWKSWLKFQHSEN